MSLWRECETPSPHEIQQMSDHTADTPKDPSVYEGWTAQRGNFSSPVADNERDRCLIERNAVGPGGNLLRLIGCSLAKRKALFLKNESARLGFRKPATRALPGESINTPDRVLEVQTAGSLFRLQRGCHDFCRSLHLFPGLVSGRMVK